MENRERRYEVKTMVMGGGLTLREGEIVSEDQLGTYAEWLRLNGAIVEVDESRVSRPESGRAYTS
jgi:hypothetical protein